MPPVRSHGGRPNGEQRQRSSPHWLAELASSHLRCHRQNTRKTRQLHPTRVGLNAGAEKRGVCDPKRVYHEALRQEVTTWRGKGTRTSKRNPGAKSTALQQSLFSLLGGTGAFFSRFANLLLDSDLPRNVLEKGMQKRLDRSSR